MVCIQLVCSYLSVTHKKQIHIDRWLDIIIDSYDFQILPSLYTRSLSIHLDFFDEQSQILVKTWLPTLWECKIIKMKIFCPGIVEFGTSQIARPILPKFGGFFCLCTTSPPKSLDPQQKIQMQYSDCVCVLIYINFQNV